MKEHIKSNVATLWTIQTREAFETLNKTGRWYVFESLEDLEKSQMNDIDNNKETMERIEKSWDRIFDLEHCKTVIGENGPQSIQATFWKLEIENVKKIEFFSAK